MLHNVDVMSIDGRTTVLVGLGGSRNVSRGTVASRSRGQTSHRKPSNAQRGLALQNGHELSIPELHRRALFGVIAVAIVDARDVLLLRMIQDSTDLESWHAAARHETRRRAPQVVSTNVDSIACLPGCLRLHNDIGAGALRKAAADVFVIT